MFTGHQCRADDDEQRPEIGDQAGIDGWSVTQRGKIKEMVAKKPDNAEQPDPCRLAQMPRSARPPKPRDQPEARADCERHGCQLKWRNLPRNIGEKREHRPHDDRKKPDKCSHATAPGSKAAAPLAGMGRLLYFFETGRVDSHRTDLRADLCQHRRIDSGVAERCKGETDLARIFQIFDGFSPGLVTGNRDKFGGAGDRVTFESFGGEGLRLAGR